MVRTAISPGRWLLRWIDHGRFLTDCGVVHCVPPHARPVHEHNQSRYRPGVDPEAAAICFAEKGYRKMSNEGYCGSGYGSRWSFFAAQSNASIRNSCIYAASASVSSVFNPSISSTIPYSIASSAVRKKSRSVSSVIFSIDWPVAMARMSFKRSLRRTISLA